MSSAWPNPAKVDAASGPHRRLRAAGPLSRTRPRCRRGGRRSTGSGRAARDPMPRHGAGRRPRTRLGPAPRLVDLPTIPLASSAACHNRSPRRPPPAGRTDVVPELESPLQMAESGAGSDGLGRVGGGQEGDERPAWSPARSRWKASSPAASAPARACAGCSLERRRRRRRCRRLRFEGRSSRYTTSPMRGWRKR